MHFMKKTLAAMLFIFPFLPMAILMHGMFYIHTCAKIAVNFVAKVIYFLDGEYDEFLNNLEI